MVGGNISVKKVWMAVPIFFLTLGDLDMGGDSAIFNLCRSAMDR